MYRAYENPYGLERRLSELRGQLTERLRSGDSPDSLVDLQQDLEELTARVNYGWQDWEEEER